MSTDASPSIYRQMIEVNNGLSVPAQPIHLEIREQALFPTQGKRRRHSFIDLLLHAVQPDGFVGHMAGIVSRVRHLHVMPCVRAPLARIAVCLGMPPYV